MTRRTAAVEPTTVWRYLPLSEYDAPSGLTAEAVLGFRRISKGLWARLRGTGTGSDEGERADRERPSPEALSDLVPRFDVESAASALEQALEGWTGAGPGESRMRVVVGPPGSHAESVVETLARRREWARIAPPPRAHLLGDEKVIRKRLDGVEPGSAAPAVLPGLHRWLLRSELGLPVFRALLEELGDRSSPLLIGCDSWAWSFLGPTLGIGDTFGEPLVLAPFDAARLESWLGEPLRSRGVVCAAGEADDATVFPSPKTDAGSAEERDESSPSPVLVKLAAAARGNPGLALELWRRSLFLARRKAGAGDGAGGERAATIWAAHARDSEVVVPPSLESAHKFVLHAALVHGGLERDLLPAVLPFSPHDLRRWVRELSAADLLVEQEGEVSVPPAAYGVVRGFVESEGLLVDDF